MRLIISFYYAKCYNICFLFFIWCVSFWRYIYHREQSQAWWNSEAFQWSKTFFKIVCSQRRQSHFPSCLVKTDFEWNRWKKGVSLWIFLKLSTYNLIFSYENFKFVFKFVYNLGIIQAKVNHSVSRTFIFSLIIIFVILIKCKKFLKKHNLFLYSIVQF